MKFVGQMMELDANERGKGSVPDGLISSLCNIYGDHYKYLVTQLCYKGVIFNVQY